MVKGGSRQRDGLGDGPGPGTADVGDEGPVPAQAQAARWSSGKSSNAGRELPVVEVPVVVVSVDDVVDVGLVVSVVRRSGGVVVVLRGSCTFVRGTQV